MSNNPTHTDPLLIDRRAAAVRYSLSLRTVDTLLTDGILPRVKLSKRCTRIPVAEADAMIMNLKTGGLKNG